MSLLLILACASSDPQPIGESPNTASSASTSTGGQAETNERSLNVSSSPLPAYQPPKMTLDAARELARKRRNDDAFNGYVTVYPDPGCGEDRCLGEMDYVFTDMLGQMDEYQVKPRDVLAWLDKDPAAFTPFAERYYTRAIELLETPVASQLGDTRPTILLNKRNSFDPCSVSSVTVRDMANLAERLGKTDDARTWKIHDADITAQDAGGCEGCGDVTHYDTLEAGYNKYVELKLDVDAKAQAKRIADANLEDYHDGTNCMNSGATDVNGRPVDPKLRCIDEHLASAKEWYAKAGLPETEVTAIATAAVTTCTAVP